MHKSPMQTDEFVVKFVCSTTNNVRNEGYTLASKLAEVRAMLFDLQRQIRLYF